MLVYSSFSKCFSFSQTNDLSDKIPCKFKLHCNVPTCPYTHPHISSLLGFKKKDPQQNQKFNGSKKLEIAKTENEPKIN